MIMLLAWNAGGNKSGKAPGSSVRSLGGQVPLARSARIVSAPNSPLGFESGSDAPLLPTITRAASRTFAQLTKAARSQNCSSADSVFSFRTESTERIFTEEELVDRGQGASQGIARCRVSTPLVVRIAQRRAQ
jgi:hypothetical protein